MEVAKKKKSEKYCDLFYILILWNTLCSFYTCPSVVHLKLFFIIPVPNMIYGSMAKLCKVIFLHAAICDFPTGRLLHGTEQQGVCY